MKYLVVVILLVVFSTSCHVSKCNLSFSKDFNISILSTWEKQTSINVTRRKNDMLMSLFKLASEKSISLFERREFLEDISHLSQFNTFRFDSLIVVEVNRSGERYRTEKYLIAFCDQETSINRFELKQGNWEFIQAHKEETNKISKTVMSLMDRSDSKIYWGGNINDLVAVSNIRGHNEIAVEVFGHLSEKQYRALNVFVK